MTDVLSLFDTAKEIVAQIEKGEWTATQVLDAYIARATVCQETTNCLTEGLCRRLSH